MVLVLNSIIHYKYTNVFANGELLPSIPVFAGNSSGKKRSGRQAITWAVPAGRDKKIRGNTMIWKDPVALLSPLNRDKSSMDNILFFIYSMKCPQLSPHDPEIKPKPQCGAGSLGAFFIFRPDP